MKETGIIMSGNHPRLIKDGEKTVTRRTYGLNKINEHPELWRATPTMNSSVWAFYQGPTEAPSELIRVKCPYGGVGDRLWVRATWSKNFKGQMLFKYQKDALTKMLDLPEINILWKPSIHLLKKDAEIWLEITEVRAERVHEISPPDIVAEGYDSFGIPSGIFWFKDLWDSLNAKRGFSWDFNPWVWPLGFKVLTEEV